MFFFEGKISSLILCNVVVVIKLGGGKLYGFLGDFLVGWDGMGLGIRFCIVCDSRCGLGYRFLFWRFSFVKGRVILSSV